MNKIYKVVWNTVRNCYVVGSELISSKSGRHSTSNGKSSSLKVTLTVLALCGMTALGSGVVPAYAADAGTAVESQYVAVLVNKENNSSRNTRTFDGYRYHKETVSDQSYWVRDGYTIKYEENERYPGALKDNIIKAYKNDSYTASSDAGLLKSNQIMVESAGVSTLTGVNLDDVSGGTYVGATNSGSTSTPSSFNYMIKDDNGTYVDAGKTNFSKRFKAATKNTDGTYSYKGEVIANDNLYVVDNTVGVFLTSSGKVYTGKVFGANNEVLMTTKSDSGTMYSYWGADTPDPNTKLADMTIGQFNQALEKVNNNSKAVAGDTIKEIKTTAKTDGGTIDLVRRGQYNSATGQYEGEHKVGSGITITSHGGTNGEDVKINFSNGTTGFDVAAGSKVEAVKAMDSATDITGLTINGETYNIKTGQNYTAGDNVSISADNVISATNTTLVAGDAEKQDDSYIVKDTAGNEVVLKDVASVATVTNNYTTLDAKIDNTKTTITNEYNTAINNAKTHYYSVNSDETGEGSNYNNDGAIGLDSIAVGANAYANGRIGASAFGNDAYANGERALAVGNGSKAQGLAAIAIGTGDSRYGADGTNAIAVGEQSYAKGDYTTAIGGYSKAVADKATAFGHQAVASGSASTAIGMQSQALGTQSTAIGDYSNAQGTATAAFGGYSKTTGDFATSLGYTSESVIRGTAVGAASSVTGEMGTAVGLLSSASVWGGVALGGQSSADTEAGVTGYSPNAVEGEDLTSPTWTSTLGAVSVGTAATVDEDGTPVAQKTRQITNLAAGTVDTDAVNVAQLKKARVELTDGTHTTVKTTHDQTDGHVIYSVDVDTSGKIEQNNTNIVTGDTVYNALQDVSWTAKVNGQVAKTVKKDDTLNFINGDNIAINNENGDIKISTTGLASSGDLWTARVGTTDVRPVDKKVNFAGSDHIMVTGSDGQITFATTGLADTNFTNITEEGNTYIKKLAKGEDVHIKADTYTVGNDGSVTMTYVDGNGKPVAGEATITGIAKSDLSNITEEGDTYITKVANKAVKVIDGQNTTVTPGTDGDITTYAVNVDTSGKIEQNNTNIVTGDTVYNALQDVSWTAKVNGQVAKPVKKDDTLNFINGDNIAITSNNNGDIKISTTGLASSGDLWTAQAGGKDVTAVNQKVNFNSTDKHLVVESTKDGEITFATKDLADTSFTNITKEGNTYIKNLAKGEDRHIEAKEYAVGNDGSVTMTYVDGNGNTIDGTAKITGIAKSDLSNITNKGNTVINNIAKNAVKVIGGTNTAVETSTTDNGPVEYKVNLNKDVNLGDTIQLNGSDGSISAKSGGAKLSFNNNGLTVSQAKNGLTNETRINGAEITVDGGIGNQTTIKGSTARIGNVLVNGGSGTATITGLTNKTTDYTGFANGSGRAATEEQLKEVDSKAAAAKTTVTNGKNITVDEAKADDGSSTYTVGLATDVVLGDNAIKLNGSDGSISAKSGGAQLAFNNSGLTVSQAKNGLTNETRIDGATITVDGGTGNQTIINGSTARIGSVLVNGGGGTATITGLTNKTTDYTGFANGSGRAATEEQLKEVAGKAGEAIETAGKGWNLTTNGKESSKTNIKPDGTVDFSSGNDNLVISNAGANLSFSLSDNLDLTNNKDKKGSVKVGENTALTDELLQVGKDVSLTASALNVGNSSLTTSALTVGNSMLTTDALTVGGHSYITSSGINANNMRITNVAAGINGTDAVNVNQLKSAISGSQVSIDAGTGIIVEKTGNKYTIKTNIEGLSNDHGTVTVSTNKDSALVTDSGASMPAHAKRMNLMLMADDLAEVPETTTLMGDTLYVKHSANSVKLITDEIANHEDAVTLNDGEKIDFVGGKNIKTFSEHGTDANGKNYDKITFSLKDDISVTSVTTDKVTINNGPTINSSGINMNNQKITNLKDGEIAEGSKDAVNGGQIYDLKQNVSTNTENINILNEAVVANAENINSLSHSLNKLDSRINRVGAGAAALAALHPLDFDPDNKWDFAAGYGNYAGANAVAIGTYYRPNENTMFSIGGSFGGGENMINAGVSFKLGSGSSGITTSKTVMAKKIKEQDELLKAQDAKMKEQDEKIAKLEALVAQQGEMIQQALGKK